MKNQVLYVLGACMLILFAGCSSDKTKQEATPSGAKVTRTLPASVRGGENFTVSLKMEVIGNPSAVGLEEDYPPGWTISNIPLKGVPKPGPDRIEWLFWAMGEPIMNRTINYTITAPPGYSGTGVFSGKIIAKATYKTDGDESVNVIS